MDSLTVICVAVYFLVGWFLADTMTKNDSEEMATFLFMFWPVVVAFLLLMLILVILMVVAVLITKLIGIFDNKGDKPDGAV